MPDIWIDVDVAVVLPVNVLPLTDDSDFKTRETGITYDQAGMDLVWNFVPCAGTPTQTAVTPTTGGDYDWAHTGDGMYSIEMTASGGASANNDTEGFGWFIGFCTGVLPWRSPIFGFRAAALNNLLVESAFSATRGLAGTALPDAVADAAGGLPVSDAGELDLDGNVAAALAAYDPPTKAELDSGLTGLNDLSAAQVNAEVDAAIETYGLHHLLAAAVVGGDITDNSIIAKLVSKEATADWDDYVNTTDSLQALRDRGDAAWTTGAGGDATEEKQDTLIAGHVTLIARLDEISAVAGSGADQVTLTINDTGGSPIPDADIWVTSDSAGLTVVAGTLQTNSAGQATFLLDAGVTYYRWAQKDGHNFANPQSFVAVAD